MNGPEHYREAERLLAASVNESLSDVGAPHYEAADGAGGYDYSYLAAAQVHATLALAAATAEDTMSTYYGPDHRSAASDWSRVTNRSAGIEEAE